MRIIHRVEQLSWILALLGGALALYVTFVTTPNEQIMGPVQRIFYFHVGSASACNLSLGVVFIAALLWFATRDSRADVAAEAATEVGFIFASIVLASGMIWGHAAWNTWFNWEPRLVTFLMLWLILLGMLLLRQFGDPHKMADYCASLGIFGAITVPVVVYSIKFWPGVPHLHPQVIEKRGLDPAFVLPLILATVALVLLGIALMITRSRLGILQRRFDYE